MVLFGLCILSYENDPFSSVLGVLASVDLKRKGDLLDSRRRGAGLVEAHSSR
jgi:hypothetical protein